MIIEACAIDPRVPSFLDTAMLEFVFDTTARALPEQTTFASENTTSTGHIRSC